MKVLKVVGIIIGVVILVFAGLLTFVKNGLPNVGEASDMQIELTSERIERGDYLSNHVMMCVSCHSNRDFDKFAGPVAPGSEYAGGKKFDQEIGLPGSYVPVNLTPSHLGDWTDGEIFRAITAGVSKDGRALFPIMPHPYYGTLDEEDIKSVIAYLRTLEPVDTEVEVSYSDFPMSFIINLIPQAPSFEEKPDYSDLMAYGEYLVTAAACNDCHTYMEGGSYTGEFMAGGNEYNLPSGGKSRASNITPHDETGIGLWTEAVFVARFKAYADSNYVPRTDGYQSYMPWMEYSGLTEDDLKAIYAYLKSIPAVENKVVPYTPATE